MYYEEDIMNNDNNVYEEQNNDYETDSYEDDFEEERYTSQTKKSSMGRLKPTSSINPDFIPETKIIKDAEVAKAINELKQVCRKKKCPVFINVVFPGADQRTEFLTPYELEINDDAAEEIISSHIKLSNGFHITKDTPTEILVDDIQTDFPDEEEE